MSPAIIELLVLAGIAIFLIMRLRNVLGTREGFEKPAVQEAPKAERPNFKLVKLKFLFLFGVNFWLRFGHRITVLR